MYRKMTSASRIIYMDAKKQELPPPGGFSRIIYERVPLKPYLPAPVKWLLLIGVMTYGWYDFYQSKKRITYNVIEKRAAQFSVLPLLAAEQDRVKLKLYRKVRDEEAALMKDVEGWKVGTYKGEPIYKSLKPNEWYEPSPVELFMHSDPKDLFYPEHLLQIQ